MPKALKIQALELVCIVLSCLDNAEAFAHYATAVSGKASCAGKSLSGGACDGEGGVTLATKADAGIGGSVFNEDRGLDRSCKAGEVVDVLRVHMCRVTVAVLCLYGKVDSLVNILDSYDRKNGHHKLVLYEGVIKAGLTDDSADVVTNAYTDLCKENLSVSTNAITAYGLGDDAGLGVLLINENDVGKSCGLLSGDLISACGDHRVDKLVCDVCKCEHLFFRNTGEVVIEGTAVDNVLTCLAHVGGIVNDNGGIARACADRLLTAGEHAFYNSGATRAN